MMLLAGSSRSRGSSNNHDELFRRIATAETPEDNKWIVDYITSKSKFTSITDNALNGPLHAAIRHRKFQLLSVLLSMKVLPVDLISQRYSTPLHLCLTMREKIETEVLEELIAAGANVNMPGRRRKTPLHLAMKFDYRYAHLLIQHGALNTINATDRSGRTPLHRAVRKRNFEAVSLLLYYNADANIVDDKNRTPFMLTNFYPGSSCSIQDTLLEYESTFLLEIDDYDLDHFIGSRLYEILCLCINHKNLEMFKKVWSRISPEIVELIPVLSPHLILHAPFRFIDFLLRNDYIDLSKVLNFCPTIKDLWQISTGEDNKLEALVDTVYLFLSYGGIFSVSDIQFLQRFQQYETVKELIRVLLYMDIYKSFQRRINDFSDIPYIINYVMCNINEKFEDIIDDYCHQFFTCFARFPHSPRIFDEIEKNMQQYFRFCSCDKFLKRYRNSPTSPLGCVLETRDVNVPSLVELSRNRAKDRICEKYKIKNACQFYTTLEALPVIPKKVKDIIAFRTPIYEEAGCRIIEVPIDVFRTLSHDRFEPIRSTE